MGEAAIKDEIYERLSDREWRMDNLYYIRDRDGVKVKFVRNESQRRFWNDMWYLNIILKDRQRGFSTLIAIFILDCCLFNSGTSAGIVDITLPDAKKKLAKIKFAYDNLPGSIKESVPLLVDNKEGLEWANDSSVYAATSHRGGTLQILHISEMGKIAVRFPDRARETRTGAMNTIKQGNFIITESTAEGNAGEFYEDCTAAQELRDSGAKLTELDFKFHFFAWWMGEENEIDPDGVFISPEYEKYFAQLEEKIGVKLSDRKKAWYVKKSIQQKGDMKREFPGTPEEAFEAAIEGAYLYNILLRMTKKGQITSVPFDPAYPVNTGWDYGLSDSMTIWLHQRVGFEERIIGYMSGVDDDVLYYWRELNNNYQCVWGNHFLPHDFGSRRGGTSGDASSPPKTLEQILTEAGMRDTYIIPRIENKATAIAEVRAWLPKAYIDKRNCDQRSDDPKYKSGIQCLNNYRKEWDEINGCYKNRPRHDWASHGYDGLETLVRGLNAYGCKGKIGTESDGIITKKRIG